MHKTRWLLLASMLLGTTLTGCPFEDNDEDVGDMPDATPRGGCDSDDECGDGQQCIDGDCVAACVCPAVDAPVCGDDGVTYANRCSAECAGVGIEHEGACDDLPMACTPDDCGPQPDVARCPGGDGPSIECVLSDRGECRWDVGPCPDPCACPDVYDPVCGVDGETYGNACEARCAGVEVRHEGECRDAPGECRPVDCGPGPRVEPCPDGNPPPQACRRDDADICTWFVDECPGDCACGEIYAPVCGEDGTTYGNPCEARCAGVAVAYEGECRDAPGECREDECGPAPFFVALCPDGSPPPQSCERGADGMCGWVIGECPGDCACGEIWAPVCGEDGMTYPNPCEARCAGVDVRHEGECRDDPGMCAEDECGPAPFLIAPCPDGNPPPQECRRNADGACGWVIGECAPVECRPEECGPAPGAPNFECPDGSIGGPVCERDDVGLCGWRFRECPGDCVCDRLFAPVCGVDGVTYGNPCQAECAGVEVAYEGECRDEPGECAEDACGPVPFLVPICPDGDPPPQECLPDANGECRWQIGACEPVECGRDACGPPPPVAPCPDGEGPSMQCLPRDDGLCGWVIGQCEDDCLCPREYAPVCGADGVTYDNLCLAECAGVRVLHEGECRDVDPCPDDACGPPPPIACPDGRVPPMACVPRDDGACGWDVEPCPGVCDCPDVIAPVCGADGNTYANACRARCVGVAVIHEGECREPQLCPEDACGPAPFLIAPCPGGGVPDQQCVAGADGICRWQIGECPEPECAPDACGPPPPVAACPGGNGPSVECLPRDDGACGWVIGQCEDCACFDVWDPVCGADGVTYGNACEARCAGVPVVAAGECGGGADACGLPPEAGDCEAAIRRFYFEPATGTCEVFVWGGCGGNANNFETEDECLRACGGGGEAECAPDACGPAPGAPNFMCPDGSVGGPVCEPAADGACGWMMRECPPDPAECDIDQCGPAPRPRPCADGSAPRQQCLLDEAGVCGWVTECGG